MSAETDTWMPLYIGDYTADTMHLTGPEHGAYLLLIMHYWRSGPLPDNDRALAATARTDREAWIEIGPIVRAFFECRDGKLHHSRIDRELAKAQRMVNQRVTAGKASAAKRKRQHTTNEQTNENPTTVGTVDPSPLARDSRPSPSPSPKKEPVLRTEAKPPDDPMKTLWGEGLAIVRVLTRLDQGPAKKLLGKLVNLANADHARLLALIRRAETEQPDGPQAWLIAGATALNGAATSSDLFPDALPPGVTREARTGKLVAGGVYLEEVADAACDAARIPLAEARRHWHTVVAWAEADLTKWQIVTAIQRVTDRPNYTPPNSLKFFDRAVREQRHQ